MVKMHLNGHLKKKTVLKLQLREDNWNSYLTENKFKISDEEKIQKKKLYMSKNNMIRSSCSADGKKSRDRKSREANALDLLMMDNNNDNDHNSARNIGEDNVNERHKTFLPASPPTSSSSKMRKNRLPLTASAVRRRTVDKDEIVLLSEDTAVAEMDGSHSSTVRDMDQKQQHVKTSISSINKKSSRRLFTSSMKPDPDWKHITSNIRSLYAELRYYEELSGKRSILDTRDDLDDMLMDKELNDPQSSKAIMQYLLDLVCQSLTYLLKNEVELQEERSKNDLLNAQLEDYRSGRMHDPRSGDSRPNPYTTGPGTTTSTASVPQVDYSQSTPSSHVHSNSSIGELMPGTNPYSASTPHAPSSTTRLPVSISISRGDDRNDNILTLSKMQALGQLSGPYVDAYASYMDSPIRMGGDHSVDGEHNPGSRSNGSGTTGSNPPKHLFPSLDLSRMDALINYSKAISMDNECSTIDRLSSMVASSHQPVVWTNSSSSNSNSRPIDGYDSDDSVPPPPPPSHVVGSSFRMPPPPPPVVVSSAQDQMKRIVSERPVTLAMNAPVIRMTSKQDAAISMRMTNHGGRMNTGDGTATTPVMMLPTGPVAVGTEQMKTSKPVPSPMTMNGSSASDWLFFDFSTPTPYYTGLPPHQSSSAATTTTHLYPSGISNSSMAGNDDHDNGGRRGEFDHRLDDRYDQYSRGISVLGQEQSSSTGRRKCMTEQVSIVQPLVDVPVPHTAPTHPYVHHQARSSNSSAPDHAINYQLHDDSGLSPIAKELMNQYRLPLQQRTFDARNGSF